MMILAIDPGNTESGYALIDAETRKPVEVGKVPNEALLVWMAVHEYQHLAIEMVQSFGMGVGADVFETCVWIGRFIQRHDALRPSVPQELVYRQAVKMHHCHNAGAKDSNIAQALRDRFAKGERNYGKGTKAEPGWFYGFAADAWQAYALAVLVADRINPQF